jgi:hypothetical protein
MNEPVDFRTFSQIVEWNWTQPPSFPFPHLFSRDTEILSQQLPKISDIEFKMEIRVRLWKMRNISWRLCDEVVHARAQTKYTWNTSYIFFII